ncbi:MAG TPA: 3-methyl-2-oxobutanoate dehydrogenase subunit VorB [Candidatus Ornithocaccomicrobium faecavium]|uniref:3-methyl-2-oxobutanoate dehydrogenase subunit VorB n=1 Tax=Candidatus Ornithocaccomicrobium faecavium TaxID=2840890 RepID=A0A9D1TET3_9FIRM|nr:3-methyl-2-oxobutanoate dehydrogenase subunit VorB [Clostridiales bacterium]HIV29202.1 3-methyl-2-oxobutanoate dehydrogenase subunit VorB [Candidatus Ornithocaccomicrobium faecavium]
MRQMMKGNEAIAEAAVQAGCRYYFGYPITPQSEIPEYMSRRLPEVGGVFLQAESEIAAINMVYGAAGAGARAMTSSSSPGIALKQEGISYIAGAQLPCVVVNIVRGGPGLGSIQPAQSDYYQATRGGGHGDYRVVVFAPASVQEAVELTQRAFDVADQYRMPAMILGDGVIGQMMEPVEMPEYKPRPLPKKDWAATGWDGKSRPRAVINSLYIEADRCEELNLALKKQYEEIAKNECMVEEQYMDDAEYVIAAYGTTARIALTAIRQARAQGVKAGLIRPITLWPFPSEAFARAAQKAKKFLTVEMSLGQMVDDVRIAVNGARPVEFYGRTGGVIPGVGEITRQILKLAGREG